MVETPPAPCSQSGLARSSISSSHHRRLRFLSPDADENRTLRDQCITAIATRGRIALQASSSYNQRSRGETLMARWKAIIGPKLKARSLLNQKTEAKIGTHILNKMTGLGRAQFEVAA
jgi:hypothetical protein